MTLNVALQKADLEVKIVGAKGAVNSFNNDPTQSDYAKVYLNTVWEVVESIIDDYERDIAMLNDVIHDPDALQ